MDKEDLPPDVRDHLDEDEEMPIEQIWTALQRSDKRRERAFSSEAAWQELEERLEMEGADTPVRNAEPSAQPRASWEAALSRLMGQWRVLAAAVTIICAVGVGAWWWSQPVTVATAAGEQDAITLPDGSVVELSSATQINYPRGFTSLPLVGSTERRVTLDGEAYFEVEEGNSPFTVTTPNAAVEVLGTSFNVRAVAGRDQVETEVALQTGRLRLTPHAGAPDAAVDLTEPGVQSRVRGDSDPTSPSQIDFDRATAWRQGGFVMRSAPLSDILREMERRFDTQFALQVPPEETDTMTLHYGEAVQVNDLLSDIALIQDLKYRETSQGYELIRGE